MLIVITFIGWLLSPGGFAAVFEIISRGYGTVSNSGSGCEVMLWGTRGTLVICFDWCSAALFRGDSWGQRFLVLEWVSGRDDDGGQTF
jgi:hypothetical protein